MPRVERVERITTPADRLPADRRSYESPRSQWSLVLRDPREWHMGADAWKAELWRRGRNVSPAHRGVLKSTGTAGFRACEGLRPWAADGRTLALPTWDLAKPVYLYDLEERRIHLAPEEGELPHSAQWAPNLDRLLLPFATGARLYDAAGKLHGTVSWTVTEQTLYTDWTRWGMFFLLARPDPESRMRLTFYDGGNGQLVEETDLDPASVVPYDSDVFSTIARSRFTLRLSSGVRAAGFLLDAWHEARYDQATDTLRLATYRPTSLPDPDNLTCAVEASWVAVTLAA